VVGVVSNISGKMNSMYVFCVWLCVLPSPFHPEISALEPRFEILFPVLRLCRLNYFYQGKRKSAGDLHVCARSTQW
jgi:hypothetical protein